MIECKKGLKKFDNSKYSKWCLKHQYKILKVIEILHPYKRFITKVSCIIFIIYCHLG